MFPLSCNIGSSEFCTSSLFLHPSSALKSRNLHPRCAWYYQGRFYRQFRFFVQEEVLWKSSPALWSYRRVISIMFSRQNTSLQPGKNFLMYTKVHGRESCSSQQVYQIGFDTLCRECLRVSLNSAFHVVVSMCRLGGGLFIVCIPLQSHRNDLNQSFRRSWFLDWPQSLLEGKYLSWERLWVQSSLSMTNWESLSCFEFQEYLAAAAHTEAVLFSWGGKWMGLLLG